LRGFPSLAGLVGPVQENIFPYWLKLYPLPLASQAG
jgi:hypothetical protein